MRHLKAAKVAILVIMSLLLITALAAAEDKISIKGKIKSYDIDEKTLVVTADDGKEMTFVIENDKALMKLDDRLFEGDEVKIKYVVKDGKNVIKENNDLKGTKPGC
jgi:hypothetical protein